MAKLTPTEALSQLIEAIDNVGAYVDLEGWAEGNGVVVKACRAIGIPVPPNLAEWLTSSGYDPFEEFDDC